MPSTVANDAQARVGHGLRLLSIIAVITRTLAATCQELVPHTMDVTPIRSPQALHTAMLPLLVGKHVVEIGTRQGDGIACFSQVATKASAVEINQAYCRKLEQRSQSMVASGSHGFEVICHDYRLSRADAQADVYTCALRLTRRAAQAPIH